MRFQEKHTQLQYQIQQINAKLFASEEVKQLREEFLKMQEQLEMKIQETEKKYQKEIYEADKLAIIKQDTMQTAMETNVTALITDLMQASDMAIGETINKLLTNNITLGNMLTCMQETIEKARDSYRKISFSEKNCKYNVSSNYLNIFGLQTIYW